MRSKKSAYAALCTMLVFSQTLPVAAAENDEILHLTFDNEDAADSSGSNNDGTPHGVTYEKGILGKGARIQNENGNSTQAAVSYIDLPESISLGTDDLTFSLWYKTETGREDGGAIIGNKDYDSGANDGFVIGSFTSNIRANFAFDSSRKDSTFGTVDGSWHHLAVVLDRDGQMVTYQDGAQKGSADISAFSSRSLDVNRLRIGADGIQTYGVLNSMFDEVRIFRSAKSAHEIKALYDEVHDVIAGENLTGKTVLAASFDGDVKDASGRENNGTAHGEIEYVEGIKGQALHMTNSTGPSSTALQYVDFGGESDLRFGTSDFSLKFWTKSDDADGEGRALISNKDYDSGGNTGFAFGVFTNGHRSNICADGSSRKDIYNVVPNDGQWHSVLVNYDRDGMMTVYCDGLKSGESDISADADKSLDAAHFSVGADGYFKYGVIDSTIDELYVVRGLQKTENLRSDYAEELGGYAKTKAEKLIKEAQTYVPSDPSYLTHTQSKLDELTAAMAGDDDEEMITAAKALLSAAEALQNAMPVYDPDLMLEAGFDDENAADTSGRGNNGTVHGDVLYEEGISGKAIRLANTNYGTEEAGGQYVDFGDKTDFQFGTNNFSFSFWYKENADNRECALFGNKDWATGSNTGWNLGVIGSGMKMNFTPADTSRQDILMDFLNDGQWHHLAVNIDRTGEMELFADGASTGIRSISDYSDKNIDALGLVLGADALGKFSVQDASFDELKVYSRLMSVSEIKKQALEGKLVYEIKSARAECDANAGSRAETFKSSIDDIDERRLNGDDPASLLTSLSLAREAYEDELADPLITFNVLSDVHVESSQSAEQNVNLLDALNDLRYLNPESSALMVPGDLTNGGEDGQYTAFFELLENSSAYPIAALGNHDVRWLCDSDQRNEAGLRIPTCVEGSTPFKERYLSRNSKYMGNVPEGQLYYDLWLGGYHFITLNTEQDLKDQAYLSDEQIAWLDKTLEGSDPDKPVFVQVHQTFEGTGDYEDLDVIGGESEVKLKEVLKKYPQSIIFTGHIHNGKDRIDVYDREYGHVVDCPCFYYQSYGDSQNRIGYQVSVYADDIVIRLRDFANDVWLDDYTQHVDLDALPLDPSDDSRDIPVEKMTMSAGSEHASSGSEGPASNLIDKDESTIWHTSYSGDGTNMDQRWVQATLANKYWVDGVRYLPRQSGSHGDLLKGSVEVSADGQNWQTAGTFEWKATSSWKQIRFTPVEAKYVRVVPSSTYGEYASGAELRVTYVTLSEKEKLEAAVKTALTLEENDYTPQTFSIFTTALISAEKLLAAQDGTTDEEYASAREALESAQANLQAIKKVTIASFNIAAGKHPDLAAMSKQMEKDGVDAAGLQEIDMNNSRNDFDMLERLGEQGVYTHNSFQKAIDYNGGEYGIGIVSKTQLSKTDGGIYEAKTGEDRAWQKAVFEVDGEEVVLYNTHLSYENTEIRRQQMEELIAKVKADPAEYKVITGDFNADQLHSEFYPFMEEFNLVNGWNGTWLETYNQTDDSMKVYSIDNIITTRNMRIDDLGVEENELSDHNMLYAKLVLLDEELPSSQRLLFAIEDAKEAQQAHKEEAGEAWTNAIGMSIEQAETLLNKSGATQEEYDAAVLDLLEKSSYTAVDKTALNELITQAAALDEDDYTASTWSTLAAALQSARDISSKADATQSEVDGAKNALQSAMTGLTRKADKTALNELIRQAAALDQDSYTASSWSTLESALNSARIVSAKEDASQSEVNDANTALQSAIDSLKRKVDKSELNKLIEQAQALDEEDYTEDSWNSLLSALGLAQTVSNNETATSLEVSIAKSALESALTGLKEKPAPENYYTWMLEAAIAKARAMSSEDFLDGTVFAAMEAELKKAQDVLTDPTSQSEIDSAALRLNDALLKLRKKPSVSALEALHA